MAAGGGGGGSGCSGTAVGAATAAAAAAAFEGPGAYVMGGFAIELRVPLLC